MNEFGELIAKDTVRFVRTLPGPIERVWRFIVDADKRKRWLCDGNTELREGGSVEMHFHNAALSRAADIDPPEKYSDMPEHVRFSGTVTACKPPSLLSHTWEFEGEASEVTYELVGDGDQVILTLTHRKIESVEDIVSIFGGWHTHLDILADILDGREPAPFWKQHSLFEREYEKRLASDR